MMFLNKDHIIYIKHSYIKNRKSNDLIATSIYLTKNNNANEILYFQLDKYEEERAKSIAKKLKEILSYYIAINLNTEDVVLNQ